MNKQRLTTLIYVGIAAIVLCAAWLTRPPTSAGPVVDDIGERFVPAFDPLDAKALQITRINEETARPEVFRVAQADGVWSIPSHENYPAEAANQVASVATSVMDVIKGAIASDSPGDHGLLGVLDPTAEGVDPAGAGTRITLEGADHAPLIDLIIGKDVKQSPGVRYVRIPGRDRTYTATVRIDSASTRFEDWIDPDLLQMSPTQIRHVIIDDYSVDEINQRLIQGPVVEIRRDPVSLEWSMVDLKEGETLDQSRADDLAAALDELRIVDVHRKPTGLSEQLAGVAGLALDNEAVASLARRGFYISGNQLLANEGQTVVRMADGVEYTLRFGEIALYSRGASMHEDAGASEATAEETNPGRFVFVTASFNPALVAEPELLPWPEVPEPAQDENGPIPEELDVARQAALAERARVSETNAQRTRAHEDALKQGEERARRLSERFAPWYYVVPDSVYQKIRLTRAELVTPQDSTSSSDDDSFAPPMIGPPQP